VAFDQGIILNEYDSLMSKVTSWRIDAPLLGGKQRHNKSRRQWS